jgi:molybdenum-dependent DNA-binding transcriptional regulator ModE
MSRKDCRKVQILSRVKEKIITIRRAGELLGVSYRQAKRLWKRYRDEGEKGVIHRARGAISNNHLEPELKQKVLDRYQDVYQGFGPTLAVEKLIEEDRLPPISRETLRQWLLEAKLWERHRRRRPYRKRREPKHHFGELVQMDGSHHAWFGEEHNSSCLMELVDDATGKTLGLMSEQETSESAMLVLWDWVKIYGIPLALYCDLKNVYLTDREPTLEEQLQGRLPKTAFGLACEKLGIQIISAYSPQAKGRVERKHAVYQDRFVKELRLRGAKTIAEANMILRGGFIDTLNRKFSHPAISSEDFHVPLLPHQDLRDVFCFEQTRSVSQDWVVRNDNRFYQLLRASEKGSLPRATSKVTVRTWLDGSVHILHRGRRLLFKELDPQIAGRRKAI